MLCTLLLFIFYYKHLTLLLSFFNIAKSYSIKNDRVNTYLFN